MSIFTLTGASLAFAGAAETKGHLDSIVGDAVAGWAFDAQTPDAAVDVTVTVVNKATGEVAATQTVTADEYREDLKNEGVGTGNYGFHAEIVWDDLPDAVYTVSAAAQGKTLSRTLRQVNGDVQETPSTSGTYLGNYITTAYCPCYQCSEGWGRKTSSGKLAVSGHTVAVDPRVIPIGSHLMINGQEYVAEDVGGAVKGRHIDIYFDTHRETLRHGTRHADVYLIR